MTALIGTDFANPVADLSEGKGFTVGNKTRAHNGNVYIYAKAASAIAAKYYVCIDESGNARVGTDALVKEGHQIAIAPVAFAADEYGFFTVSGSSGVYIQTFGSVAADTSLYTSSTAGLLDDVSSSQTLISGIVVTTANSAATSAAVMVVEAGLFTPSAI